MRKLIIVVAILCTACATVGAAVSIPNPAVDEKPAVSKAERTAVVAGGCFWGIQAVFQHVKGVKVAWSGYAGVEASTAEYEIVSSGRTGHAESVQITYDPSQITYGQLLKIFFSVAHDPTELNRQGPDSGTQYRSALFFANEEQKKIAQAYVDQLNQAKAFKHPVVTQITPLKGFYKAEDYHQDYVTHHPNEPYVMYNDLPKLTSLRKEFPELYVGK